MANKGLKDMSNGISLGRMADALSQSEKDALAVAISENVKIIKCISAGHHEEIAREVLRAILFGNGLADLVPYFQKFEGVDLAQARQIAHEQNKRAYSSKNILQMKKLGIDQYEWLYAGWGNPSCASHESMNGKIYSLSNPPVINPETGQVGNPGDIEGCICSMRPIVSF